MGRSFTDTAGDYFEWLVIVDHKGFGNGWNGQSKCQIWTGLANLDSSAGRSGWSLGCLGQERQMPEEGKWANRTNLCGDPRLESNRGQC